MSLQTTGSYETESDTYSVSLANDGLCLTLDGLSRYDIESLADLLLLLLYDPQEEYTWQYDFPTNDVH